MYQGVVIHGDGRGRQLGFPTANIQLVGDEKPANGIYSAWARINSDPAWHRAVAHIGPRPTIVNASATVELHLLDFPDRDLYGQQIHFQLKKRLRDVQKFDSLEALVTAIAEDCRHARQFLIHPPNDV